MKAKSIIHRDLNNTTNELEALFTDALNDAYPKNPPKDLNLLSIAADQATPPEDKKAKKIFDYFRQHYQRLKKLEAFLKDVPDLNKNFEEGILEMPPDQYSKSILESISKNRQEIKEKSQSDIITKHQKTYNDYRIQYEELHKETKALLPSSPDFAKKFEDLSKRQQKLITDMENFQELLKKEQKALENTHTNYLAQTTANTEAIIDYLQKKPFTRDLNQIVSIADDNKPAPKKIFSDKLEKRLIEFNQSEKNLIAKTVDDLQERYFFYEQLNGQYLDKEHILKASAQLKKDYDELINQAKKIPLAITTDQASLAAKQRIYSKQQTKQKEQKDISDFESSFRQLVRKKLEQGLDKPVQLPQEIGEVTKKNLEEIDNKITETESFVKEFIDLEEKLNSLPITMTAKYKNAITQHKEELQSNKVKNIETKNELLNNLKKNYADSINFYNNKLNELAKKIDIVREQTVYAQGKLPDLKEQAAGPTLFKKIKPKPPKEIFMPFSEIRTNTKNTLEEAKKILDEFEIYKKATRELIDIISPELIQNWKNIENQTKQLKVDYQNSADVITKNLEDRYKKSLKILAGDNEKKKNLIAGQTTTFLPKALDFKKTLSLEPTIAEQDLFITHEQQEKYCTDLENYIKSRQSFTTIFRDSALTKEKDILAQEAIRLIRSFNTANQLQAAMDFLIPWNQDLEYISGKKYSFGKHSELEEILQNIKSDLTKIVAEKAPKFHK